MILNMDKIQFENRAEIGAIIKALEEWQEDHGKDETVQELISKLDVMSMTPIEAMSALYKLQDEAKREGGEL